LSLTPAPREAPALFERKEVFFKGLFKYAFGNKKNFHAGSVPSFLYRMQTGSPVGLKPAFA
jgi:hypothetical protein